MNEDPQVDIKLIEEDPNYLQIPSDNLENLLQAEEIQNNNPPNINYPINNNLNYISSSEATLIHQKEKHKKHQDDAVKKLIWTCIICTIFMVIEIIGGYLANSIAIMSDAAHLLSDLFGFAVSILSIYISRKVATSSMSFGYHRAEIIGALASVTLIWALTIWLLYEATLRIINPPEVDGFIMLLVAVIGFTFNLVMGIVLTYKGVGHSHGLQKCNHDHSHGDSHAHGHEHHHEHKGKHKDFEEDKKHSRHHEHDKHEHEHGHGQQGKHSSSDSEDLNFDHRSHHSDTEIKKKSKGLKDEEENNTNVNLRAAIIHVIGDALQNLGVIVAGAIIYFFPGASIVDPICTYIFSIIVVFTTVRIVKDCITILMESTPTDIDLQELEKDLKSIEGVTEIHDLHVWCLSLGKVSLSCHITSKYTQATLKQAKRILKKKYKIEQVTLQVEDCKNKHNFDCKHNLHQ